MKKFFEQAKTMTRFFQKPNKLTLIIQMAAFAWILLCTVLVNVFSEQLESIGIHGWTIFLANVLFFIKGNHNQLEGLLEDLLGGIFGILSAFLTLHVCGWLVGLGVAYILALLIPITIFLFLAIGLHPYLPYVFNTMALCFFTVSFINYQPILDNIWGAFGGVIIGNVIVNVGVIVIATLISKKALEKKSAKEETKEN